MVATTAVDVRHRPQERKDLWWLEPTLIVVVLGLFVLYSIYAGLVGANYYYDPYLSPIHNLHRYALIFATALLIFLWRDAFDAFNFGGHFGIGLGSVLMLANVVLLSGYSASCHSLRYLVGGYLDSFHRRSLRYRLWSWANVLNAQHARWAWTSLIVVASTDLYIRLL